MSTVHSVIKNAKLGDLKLEPFPHIVIDHALDSNLYTSLEAEYPFEHEILGYSGYANNARYQVSAVDGLRGKRLSPLWQEFVQYHTSAQFFSEVCTLFAAGIHTYYPDFNTRSSVGIRFKDESPDIFMDCQPGINSPVKTVSSVKGPHLDHQNEFFGGLLYFRHPEDQSTGGELDVYAAIKPVTYYGARFADESAVKKVASVPYAPNRLVLFLNTIDSIHGVSPRGVTPYTRRLVNFIGEAREGALFTIPKEPALKRLLRKFI